MKWMKERDLLIAQTMAFVQSVTGKKPDLGTKADAAARFEAAVPAEAPPPVTAAPSLPDIEAMLAESITVPAPPHLPATIARIEPKVDVQTEIRTRVANFRAHQERFNREREAYGSTTMAKVLASLREDTRSPQQGN